MYLCRHLLLLIFLVPLFHQSTGATDSIDLIGNIKNLLIRQNEEQTNGTQSLKDENQTSFQLIPSDDIVGQIIGLLNCGPFSLSPNSHLKYSIDDTSKNLRLFQACNRYFETKKDPESLQVECKYDKWIFNEIDCEKITCPRLTAPQWGHLSTNNNTYNTTVYVWCSSGRNINGTAKLFCEEWGRWNSPLPTCEVSFCHRLLPPRHGFVSNQEEMAVNQTVEFSCKKEYNLLGDSVLRCQEVGRWNSTAPVCVKMCAVPSITSHLEGVRLIPIFKYLPVGSMVQQGQRVIFSCESGYMVSSSGLSTCIYGTWRPPIRCRKACTAVQIANGNYTLSKDSSIVEYTCLPGYQLIGWPILSCTPNITWNKEVPVCTKPCTLTERPGVLSFRRKESYEIIPFGTKIVNETQVYFVCQSKRFQQKRVTKCHNGVLAPLPCISRLVKSALQIYEDGKWNDICYDSNVCRLAGYKHMGQRHRCYCRSFSESAFSKSSNSILSQQSRHTNCLSCSRIK